MGNHTDSSPGQRAEVLRVRDGLKGWESLHTIKCYKHLSVKLKIIFLL